ncbi:hypothetical protein C0991_003425 [Blastosporella zonata]|nr:hypothetical protein C0991_003425 [Blastosporella zonata]
MLSTEQNGKLRAAHFEFLKTQSAELIDLLRLVEETITDNNSLERKEWMDHMGCLCDVWERREAGDHVAWPDPPLTDEEVKVTTPSAPSLNKKLSGYALREAMRNQRRAVLEGAVEVGPARQSSGKGPGRGQNSLADDLVLEFKEADGNGKDIKVTYCVACDRRTSGRDPRRILEHAGLKCEVLRNQWTTLYNRTCNELNLNSNSTALETGQTKNLPKLHKSAPEKEESHRGTLLEHFNATKVSKQQQAHIDLLLFKFFICCAVPFAVLDNRFFRDLITGLAMNYVVPDRSAFFTRHIAQELASFTAKLIGHLSNKTNLTLSLDGWSTRAKDEIYTFHTTTPHRCAFFVEGHIFKGVSVTAEALLDVANWVRFYFLP